MTLTVSFIQQDQLFTFKVIYVPAMDPENGIWSLDHNTAFVNWSFFREFQNERNQSKRRKLLEKLPQVSNYQLK